MVKTKEAALENLLCGIVQFKRDVVFSLEVLQNYCILEGTEEAALGNRTSWHSLGLRCDAMPRIHIDLSKQTLQ